MMMAEPTESNKAIFDKEILAGLKNGDRKIFDLIFKSYYQGLRGYANGLVHSYIAAEEIVQEVFINIWKKHAQLEITISLQAYLYKSVYHGCLNHIRNAKRINHTHQNTTEIEKKATLLLLATTNTPFALMVSEEMEKELDLAISKLPEQCRKIFYLCRFDNLSYTEISQKLGVSVSTVKTQMSRAMKKLMENVNNKH